MKLRSTLFAAVAVGMTLAAVGSASAWVAIAKNSNGVSWTAVGKDKSKVQARAVAKCEVGSRFIYKSSCHLVKTVP